MNLTPDDEAMRAQNQFAVAIFIAFAVVVVFAYPLTFGPPAPNQKYSLISSLLAGALAAAVVLFAARFWAAHVVELTFPQVMGPSDRLALMCSRLC